MSLLEDFKELLPEMPSKPVPGKGGALVKAGSKGPGISIENDLTEPLLGAFIKDPTLTGVLYIILVLAVVVSVPGMGMVSGLMLSILGVSDSIATFKKDAKDNGDDPKMLGGMSMDVPALPPAEELPYSKEWDAALAEASPEPAKPSYDKGSYGSSPWGNTSAPKALSQAIAPEPSAEERSDLLATHKQSVAEPKPVEEKEEAIASSLDCLAKEIATPDKDGYFRSWFITAKTRTGKGVVANATFLMLKALLGDDVKFFGIDAKGDRAERYRWGIMPDANRFHFEGRDPGLNPEDVKIGVSAITSAFYHSTAKYKFLYISELKMLTTVLAKVSKQEASSFSTFLSNQAVGGASSHSYLIVDTNVVGVKANGLNDKEDRDAFRNAFLVTPENQSEVLEHVSFPGSSVTPHPSVFADSNRAYWTSIDRRWKPLPKSYNAIDTELKNAAPQVEIPKMPIKIKLPSDGECFALAEQVSAVLQNEGAIAMTLEQIAAKHPAVDAMMQKSESIELLKMALTKGEDLGAIQVVQMGDVFSVSRVKKVKQVV